MKKLSKFQKKKLIDKAFRLLDRVEVILDTWADKLTSTRKSTSSSYNSHSDDRGSSRDDD